MTRFKLLVRLLLSLVFVVPLFFSTLATEFFDLPKTFLIYAILLISLLLLALKFLIQRRFSITTTPFDLSLLLILASLMASTYFGSNRSQSLMNGLMPLAAGILLYFVVVQLLDPVEEDDFLVLRHVFISAVTLLGLLSFLSYFNIAIFPFSFAKERIFTPAGSSLTLMALLGLSSPLALATILKNDIRVSSPRFFVSSVNLFLFGLLVLLQTSLFGFLLALPSLALLFLSDRPSLDRRRSLLGSLGLSFFLVLVLFYAPLNFNQRFVDFRRAYSQPVALDNRSSWIIAIQTVRDYPLFGSGPGSFLSDFVRYRPLFLNQTPQWSLRFNQPSSEPYLVLATLGIFGISIFAFFFFHLLKLIWVSLKTSPADGTAFAALSLVLILLFSVPAVSLRAVFLSLLALFALKNLKTNQKSYEITPLVPAVLLTLVTLGLGYWESKMLLAEFQFKKAADAATNGDINGSINGLTAAIRYNPDRDNFHLSLASLTYSLANNLAAKKDLTDPERQTLVQLLNTSISEGKTAVGLNPFNGTNLETLASIYRNISGAVQNAGTWTVTTYQQAMQIEPTNPELPFQLGGLFYAAGNFEEAANLFTQAVNLKGDLPNYRYNLAWALRKRNLIDRAINEMTITGRLVDPESEEGKRVLADLQSFLQDAETIRSQTPSALSTLEAPTPEGNLATPTKSQVTLPSEASPSSVKRK